VKVIDTVRSTGHVAEPLLQVDQVVRCFSVRRGQDWHRAVLRAVDGVSFALYEGEVFGLVGESGCGKSTLGKLLAGIIRPSSGNIVFAGNHLQHMRGSERRSHLRNLQYIYQDPAASLNPRRSIRAALHEPLIIHTDMSRPQREREVVDMVRAVGLDETHLDRYPHELCGGQQRRVGLARVLMLRPRVVILDEPTAGIDLSLRATLLDLLLDLRARFNLTYVLISHDLRVVESISNRVAVMYLGRIVEEATSARLFTQPRHPYTHLLLNAVPEIGGAHVIHRFVAEGEPTSPLNLPTGCRFHPRCPAADDQCTRVEPTLGTAGATLVACHHPRSDARAAH